VHDDDASDPEDTIDIIEGGKSNVLPHNNKKRRRLSEQNTGPSSASFGNQLTPSHPTKRIKKSSTLWEALLTHENADDNKKSGILTFFKQCTPEEHNERIKRDHELEMMKEDKFEMTIVKCMAANKEKKKEGNRKRKQAQQERDKQSEIKEGLRSPGGTKIPKVCPSFYSCRTCMLIIN
jgi:hypothetical protein